MTVLSIVLHPDSASTTRRGIQMGKTQIQAGLLPRIDARGDGPPNRLQDRLASESADPSANTDAMEMARARRTCRLRLDVIIGIAYVLIVPPLRRRLS